MPFVNRAKLQLRLTMIENNVLAIKKELNQDMPDENEIDRRLDLIEMDVKSIKRDIE